MAELPSSPESRRDQLLEPSAGKAGLSPEEHHIWSVRLWRRMDRDGSGSITREELDCEEFRTILRRVMAPYTGRNMGGPRYARAQMNMDQAVMYFLRKADCNFDNSISFSEFKSFMYALRRGAMDSADMIFALFDLDSDHTIDQDEFREVFRFFLGHAPTEMEFQAEWGKLDWTGKGKVTRDEYVAWLKASENPVFRAHIPADEQQEDAQEAMEAMMASSAEGFELRRDGDGWRPWHGYTHHAWSEPSKGKPSHTRMKFRDTAKGKSPFNKFSRTASSTDFRPPWNQRLATAHPNWPDSNGKPKQVVGQRSFFSKQQSLPELRRHLDSKRGLRAHTEAVFAPEIPKPRSVLSHERDGSESQVLMVKTREKPAGSMRHPWTRERTKWNQHFLSPPQLADKYCPPPSTAIGAPPRHLYADLYDDEF